MSVRLRGYAVPFNQLGGTHDGYEVVVPGAFRNMLRAKLPVRLQFGTHDDDAIAIADTASGTLKLHEDEYGLAFQAELDELAAATWTVMTAVVHGKHVGASVLFNNMQTFAARFKGDTAIHVERATIEHIAITESPAYRGTHVWRADVALDYAPWRVRDLNERWQRGYDLRLADEGDRYPHVPEEIAASRQRALATFRTSTDDEARYHRLLRETAKARSRALAAFRISGAPRAA